MVLATRHGDLDINEDVTIIGLADGSSVVDASGLTGQRVFNALNGDATFRNLTITGGDSTGFGGGITISSSSTVDLDNITVTGNSAATHGGGIYSVGTLTVTNSTISDNNAASLGGGISASSGSVQVNSVTVSGNTAGTDGGGVYLSNGSHDLTNVTVSGNAAGDEGGGVYVAQSGIANLEHVTITDNSALNEGGGVTNKFSQGIVNITGSIVAGNNSASSVEVEGTLNSGGNNIIGDNAGDSAGGSGYVASDLLDETGLSLGALADNGGVVQTHELLAGSAGIDGTGISSIGETDARQYLLADSVRDTGAFERGATPPPSEQTAPASSLWVSTLTSHSDSSAPGQSEWDDVDVIQIGDPNLVLESGDGTAGTSNGTFNEVIDFDLFAGSAADTDAIHYVQNSITVGGVALNPGDVLFSGFTFTTYSSENSVSANAGDVYVFQPSTAGDYSSGTFTNVVDVSTIGLPQITGFSLVEADVTVGDASLERGDFVFLDSTNQIHHYNLSAATSSVLVDGNDLGIDGEVAGVHLVTAETTIGGQVIDAGRLIVSLDMDDASTFDNTISVTQSDVVALTVTKTGVGTTKATGSILFDGSDLELAFEDWDALTIAGESQAAHANDAPLTDLSSGIEINTDGGNDSYLIANDGGAILGGATALTFEMTFAGVPSAVNTPLISYAAGEAEGNDFYVQIEADGDLLFFIAGTNEMTSSFDFNTLLDGEKHSIALSWDNAFGSWAVYVDGKIVDSGLGAQGRTIAGSAGTGELVFGNDQDTVGGGFEADQAFQGTFYDVRLWDSLRTPTEIQQFQQQKLNPADLPSGLIANWQFDGFEAGEIVDVVSRNNLSVGQPETGFIASTPIVDLNIDEHTTDGTQVGYVIPTGGDNTPTVDSILASDSTLSYDETTGKFYKAVEGDFTWIDANLGATSTEIHGVTGQLVTIRSQQENDLVQGLASSLTTPEDVWIGASDQNTEGDWHWYVDGVQDDADLFYVGDDRTGSPQGDAYTNWQNSGGIFEPNADTIGEDYARLNESTGEWRDTDISTATYSYVVEWDASEVLGNSSGYTFTLTDDASGRFAIDDNTGEITVANGSELMFESNPSHDVTVEVTDSAGKTYDEVLTIVVNDVVNDSENTAPTFFVGDGVATTNTVPNGTSNQFETANAIEVLPNGKTLVAGQALSPTAFDFTIVQYNADGTLDTTFGTDGITQIDFGGGSDDVNSIAIQDDGKIVLGGKAGTDFGLARLNSDGTLDTTFGGTGTGRVSLSASSGTDEINSIAIDDVSGDIIVTGYADFNNSDLIVARFDSDGILDATFAGGTGIATIETGGSDVGQTVRILGDRSILIGGTNNTEFSSSEDEDFVLVKLTEDGELDTDFGDAGIATIDLGLNDDELGDFIVQDDGRIVIVGTTTAFGQNQTDLVVIRYEANGLALDPSFGTGGVTRIAIPATNETGVAVALQDDGKIVVTGESDGSDVIVVRLDASGDPDNSFDSDGISVLDLGGTDVASDIAIGADGGILIAGTSDVSGGDDFTLLKVDQDGSLDTNFAPDTNTLDGNPTFIEGGSPVFLDENVEIFDAELSAMDNFAGATLSLSPIPNSGDHVLGFDGTPFTLGQPIVVSGVTIGAAGSGGSGTQPIFFNSSATNELVNQFMQLITYENTSNDPPATVDVLWVFSDGNSGDQGTGGTLFASGNTIVNITPVEDNEPPEITNLDGDVVNVTAGGPTTLLDVGADALVSDVDSIDFDSGLLAVTINSADTANERLEIISTGTGPGEISTDGAFVLFGGIEIGTLSASVNGSASTWTLEIELNGDADSAAVSALVNAIAYENSNGSSSGTRIVDFVLEDGDGGTSNVSSVTVNVAANMAPDSNSISEGFTEDTTAEITVGGTDSDGTVAGIRILNLPDAAHGVLYTDAGESDAVVDGAIYATTDGSLTLFFVPAADFNGDTSFEFAAIDDQGLEDITPAQKSLEGTAVNDAPVLDGAANPQFDPISEDDIDNAGETVGSLLLKLGDPITDVDGDPEGIAVTDNNGNGGTWQYSTDGGANWFDVGPVSTANALLLRDTDLLRLNPDGEQRTNANLGFRAWDQSGSTEGAEGTYVDVTPTGTDSPFSTQALSAQIEVTDVNDAPVLDNAGQNTLTSIDEDDFNSSGDTVARIITSAGNPDAITDVDADADEGIAIYTADSTTELGSTRATVALTWTDFGTPSAAAALLLTDEALVRFVPNEGFSGNAAFSYQAWDQTIGAEGDKIPVAGNSGGSNSLSTGDDTATITVNPINDAPTIDLDADDSAGTNGIDFNTSFESGGPAIPLTDGAVVGDVDGTIQTLTIRISNIKDGAAERLTFFLPDGLDSSYVASSGILRFTAEASATNADFQQVLNSITYQNTSPTPDPTTREITFVVNDGELDSSVATTFVSFGSDTGDAAAPVEVNNSSDALDEGTTLLITSDQLRYSDQQATSSINYSVTSAPGNGFLALSTDATTPVSSFTQEDIDLDKLIYVHDGSETTSDQFLFTVDDGLGNSDSGQFDLFINPVNDAPVVTNNGGVINEGGTVTLTSAMLQATDDDDAATELTFLITNSPNGQIEFASNPGVSITSFTQAQIDAGEVVFVHNGSEPSTAGFDFQLADGGEDGVLPASGTFRLTVSPINDAPTAFGESISINEDVTFVSDATNNLLLNDSDADGDPLTVTTTPAVGPTNGTVTLNEDGSFTYRPDADFSGSDSFTYQVTDGTATDNATVNVTVAPVNDAPELTGGMVIDLTVSEDSGFTSLGLAGLTHSAGWRCG